MKGANRKLNNFYNRAWAEVNLDAVKANHDEIRRKIHKNCKLMAIIKADAYGHGSVPLGHFYEDIGVDYLGVASLDEAKQLRFSKIACPILILGHTNHNFANELLEGNITQTIYSLENARGMSDYALSQNSKIKVHIKVDTGMTRLGIFCQDDASMASTVDLIKEIYSLKGLEFEGIFTHFSVADEGDNQFTQVQFERFSTLLSLLKSQGITFPIAHCANSGAILNHPHMALNMVRAGLILYGIFPNGKVHGFNLKPALALKAHITNVKTVESGVSVSYGRAYHTRENQKLATVAIGYGDGLSRVLSGKIRFIVNGTLCQSVGNICMDQCVIDVTHLENISIDDTATIFGGKEDTHNLIEEIARNWGTINYEILCQISKRIPRIYFKCEKPVGSLTYLI